MFMWNFCKGESTKNYTSQLLSAISHGATPNLPYSCSPSSSCASIIRWSTSNHEPFLNNKSLKRAHCATRNKPVGSGGHVTTSTKHYLFFPPTPQIVINSLVLSIPAIINVVLVCLVFWLIFAIMGYQFFGGKFYKCIDNVTKEKLNATFVVNRTQCDKRGHRWINAKINYDDAFSGFLALFQVVCAQHQVQYLIRLLWFRCMLRNKE